MTHRLTRRTLLKAIAVGSFMIAIGHSGPVTLAADPPSTTSMYGGVRPAPRPDAPTQPRVPEPSSMQPVGVSSDAPFTISNPGTAATAVVVQFVRDGKPRLIYSVGVVGPQATVRIDPRRLHGLPGGVTHTVTVFSSQPVAVLPA